MFNLILLLKIKKIVTIILFMSDIRELREALDRANTHQYLQHHHVRFVAKQRVDPFIDFDDSDFIQRYRLSKEGVKFVINLLREELTPETNNPLNIPVETSVFVALRYYATGDYQIHNADFHGLSQATVSRCIAKVSSALAQHASDFISMPDDLDSEKENFYEKAYFPNVIGCVGCQHVKVKKPDCPNSWYLLKVQIVCDSSCRITDLVTEWREINDYGKMWEACGVKKELSSGELLGKGIILGDSSYPCESYLLTPVDNPVNPEERRYNAALNYTKVCVKDTFKQWKAMFRSLNCGIGIKHKTAKEAILAMAALYNIHKQFGDFQEFLHEFKPANLESKLSKGSQDVVQYIDLNLNYRKDFIKSNFL